MAFKVMLAATVVLAAAAATTAGASPATLDVTSVAMVDPSYVTFSNAATPTVITETVEDAPLELTLDSGATLLAFCIDISHPIDLGSVQTNYDESALVYHQGALTNDSSGATTGTGAPLSSTQIAEIGGLVNLGVSLAKADTDPDLPVDLSAVQAAIWAIANPGVIVAASAPYPGRNTADVTAELNTQIAYYESYAAVPANQSTTFATYFDTADNTQGFSVPEPGAWALMLLGLGGVGAALRGRRLRGVAAA